MSHRFRSVQISFCKKKRFRKRFRKKKTRPGKVRSHLCGDDECMEEDHWSYESIAANIQRIACHNHIKKLEKVTRRFRIRPLKGAYTVAGMKLLVIDEVLGSITPDLDHKCDGHGSGKLCFVNFGESNAECYELTLLKKWKLARHFQKLPYFEEWKHLVSADLEMLEFTPESVELFLKMTEDLPTKIKMRQEWQNIRESTNTRQKTNLLKQIKRIAEDKIRYINEKEKRKRKRNINRNENRNRNSNTTNRPRSRSRSRSPKTHNYNLRKRRK